MENHGARIRSARIAVRVSAEDQREIEETAKKRGYSSPSAFIRTAIRNELHGREELIGIEERISGSFDRLSSENLRLSRAVQALFALVEALSKTVLTCVPEPPADARPQAVALARERYHRLIQSAAAGMSGEFRAAMDLLRHDPPR
ncbi:MAG TPA: ribbon-helix-helix domain-containing protein [Bryobacteraceae bacterium]|nr:ribbon-helix-helix domain-containing protein [Bryobacteraceae bacterium]